jgi:hypothetical protein
MRPAPVKDQFRQKSFPNYRNVSLAEKEGVLIVGISAVNNAGSFLLIIFVAVAVLIGALYLVIPALVHARTLTEAFAMLLLMVFLFAWFTIAARENLRKLCVIELCAGSGVFRWSYQLYRSTRTLEAPQHDATAVTATNRWYSNRLSVTIGGKVYSVTGLLDEDLAAITRKLRCALPLNPVPQTASSSPSHS